MNTYSDIGGLSKSDQYELTTATDRPTPSICMKKQKKNFWWLCLTAGCVINFVLVIITISLLAYYMSNDIATRSEVARISQELEVSQMFSGSNGSSFGSPGPVGPPGLPGTPGKTSCLQKQTSIID